MHAVVYLAIYEDNTDMCLSAYVLLYVDKVLFTVSACIYINDANWLHYLHESGYTS